MRATAAKTTAMGCETALAKHQSRVWGNASRNETLMRGQMPSRQNKRCQTNGEAAQIGRGQCIQIIRVDNRPEKVQRRIWSIVSRVEAIEEGKKNEGK